MRVESQVWPDLLPQDCSSWLGAGPQMWAGPQQAGAGPPLGFFFSALAVSQLPSLGGFCLARLGPAVLYRGASPLHPRPPLLRSCALLVVTVPTWTIGELRPLRFPGPYLGRVLSRPPTSTQTSHSAADTLAQPSEPAHPPGLFKRTPSQTRPAPSQQPVSSQSPRPGLPPGFWGPVKCASSRSLLPRAPATWPSSAARIFSCKT